MTSLLQRRRRIALPRSSRTLSYLLRVSRRSLDRSSLDMSPSHSPVLRSAMVVHRTFSPIAQAQDSESVGLPDVALLVSPLVDVGTDTVTDVNRPVSPLSTVENLFVQDKLWAPVALPSPDVGDRHETPVPRWRLAWEGLFLAERSPE